MVAMRRCRRWTGMCTVRYVSNTRLKSNRFISNHKLSERHLRKERGSESLWFEINLLDFNLVLLTYLTVANLTVLKLQSFGMPQDGSGCQLDQLLTEFGLWAFTRGFFPPSIFRLYFRFPAPRSLWLPTECSFWNPQTLRTIQQLWSGIVNVRRYMDEIHTANVWLKVIKMYNSSAV